MEENDTYVSNNCDEEYEVESFTKSDIINLYCEECQFMHPFIRWIEGTIQHP